MARFWIKSLLTGWMLGLGLLSFPGFAQQINVGSPFTGFNDSYYENFGVNFGFRLPGGGAGFGGGSRIVGWLPNGQFAPNITFSQGSAGSAIPQFGGFDPGSQGSFGFTRLGSGGGGFSLGMTFGKGSSRTMTSTTPSLTVQNGMGGSVFHGTVQPFVTGVIPVTGSATTIHRPVNGVTLAQASGQLDLNNLGENIPSGSSDPEAAHVIHSSTAETAVESVEAIRARKERQRAAAAQDVATLIERATAAAAENQVGLARSYLKKALERTTDSATKQTIRDQLSRLPKSSGR